MDFFERQDRALKNTKLLVFYFISGVLLMIVAVYVAVLLVFGFAESRSRDPYRPPVEFAWWQPQLFLYSALGTVAVVGFGSLHKTLQLSSGGSAVAEMLGGSLVNPTTTDPEERKLLNVVEEMAIASGVPVPQVYVLRNENGINAFAAGHNTGDAVVAVTNGTLRLLSRDELQGVIAHEFSHILHGDMRLNMRLMGIIFGILALTIIGRVLLYVRGGSSRDRNPLPLLGLALLVIGWIGFVFGRLIQAAVSRQREFLADASAVQFTRNPGGLAGALKKIGGLSYGAKLSTPQAGEASHMFFGDAIGSGFAGLFSTHPPLTKRIRAIDPSFEGAFPRVEAPAPSRPPAAGYRRPAHALENRRVTTSALSAPPVIAARQVINNVGQAPPPELKYAETLRDEFAPAIREATSDPLGASAIIFALLMSDDEKVASVQSQLLVQNTSQGVLDETLRILPAVRRVAAHARLPLVDWVMPQLRQFAPAQFRQFNAAVKALTEADQQIDLFEYVLQKLVLRHLASNYEAARRGTIHYYALQPLAGDAAVLLSALAYAGHTDPHQVRRAFESGAELIKAAAGADVPLVPPDSAGLEAIDSALNRLALAAPQLKKTVVNACSQAVATDGLLQQMEYELLRAICASLDCPLPPWVSNPKS